MSIRFAASATPGRLPHGSTIASAFLGRTVSTAANDNCTEGSTDHMLRAALRHFAEHGLGAARAARAQAEKAFFAGDRASYDWWLGVTRTLDRRLAIEAEREFAPGDHSG